MEWYNVVKLDIDEKKKADDEKTKDIENATSSANSRYELFRVKQSIVLDCFKLGL